jgi:hypothetical protein
METESIYFSWDTKRTTSGFQRAIDVTCRLLGGVKEPTDVAFWLAGRPENFQKKILGQIVLTRRGRRGTYCTFA